MLAGDAESFCDGFEVEISIESDEVTETIVEMIRLARRMCFTEKALISNVPVTVRQKHNGEEILA